MSDDDILVALKDVIDPEIGLNIVDLGLVYRATRGPDGIDVALTMTTHSCPLSEMLVEEAKQALHSHFPESSFVSVELVWDPPWSSDRMSEEGRRQLGLV
jgi:metal-sulfur cluster biosynthetic enzyme